MKAFLGAMLVGSTVVLLGTVMTAEAEVRARCDYRAGRGERTKISVDLNDLAGGRYSATVNGRYVAVGAVTPPADEFEADFDSNRLNVANGATAIPAWLGRAGKVSVVVEGPGGSSDPLTVPCPGEVRIP